jgi:hypothetical protein
VISRQVPVKRGKWRLVPEGIEKGQEDDSTA